MDVLSDVLRTIRLEGALFLNGDMHAPWCFKVPKGTDMAQLLKPGARRLAICHLVLQGECWAQVEGGEPIRAHAGEVIAVPHGDSHVLGSGLHHAAVDMAHLSPYVNRPSPKPSGRLSAKDLVAVLLKQRADPNLALRAPLLMRAHSTGDATLAAGATPLMRASKALDLDLMKVLLEHGADPSRALANGTTTLMVALTGRGARALTRRVVAEAGFGHRQPATRVGTAPGR